MCKTCEEKFNCNCVGECTCRIELHCHSDYSNLRLLDSINSIEGLLETASELGLKGLALTEHETISSHVKMIQTVRKFKEQGKLDKDFTLILGNEIYLVDSLEEVRDNYQSGVTKFPHYLLLAKNAEGHEALRILSSKAWENSFYTGTMERVPTIKSDLEDVVKRFPNSLIASTACFLEGTKVNINGVLKNIEEINSGDLVLTHKGNIRNVNFPTSRDYVGDIHTIVTKGSSFPITSTSDHKFLAIPSEKELKKPISEVVVNEEVYKEFYEKYRTKSKGAYKLKLLAQEVSPFWVEAKNLSEKHELLRLIDEDVVDLEYIDISEHHLDNSKYRIPNVVKVDEDLLWLLGIYTAEGSLNIFTKGSICFTIDSEKQDLINNINRIFIDKFKIKPSITKKESRGVDISVNSIEIYSLFSSWFKSGAINKAIPNFIKKLPFEKQIYFLKGYFLGDGYYRVRDGNKYNISCSTISKQLAYDIVSVFNRGGVNPLINQNPAKVDKNGVHHQQWYSIELNSSMAKKFINFIYFDEELSIEAEDYRYKDIPFIWEGRKYVRNKVVKNTFEYYEGKVYCLNVDVDHSFEAEGMIVHNCLGSESSICILEAMKAKQEGNTQKQQYYMQKLINFIEWNIELHGKDNFFLELQPSADYEQSTVNKTLVKLSHKYNLKLIITNDAHYLRPEDMPIHGAYLNSKQDERETESFYANTYLHTVDEIYNKMSYLDKEIIKEAIHNTMVIGGMIEDYTLERGTVIPKTKLPEFEVEHLFKGGYNKYGYINQMAHSDNEQDRYLIHLIERGFREKIPYRTMTKQEFHKVMARINIELEELWEMSKILNQSMASYYVTVAKLVELIWGDDCGYASKDEGSIVGAGRGSAVAFLINYLISVTEVNPLAYGIEVPHWRHLHKSKPDISALDIDLDVTSTKKKYIFDRMRDFFGQKQVIQVCTFGTEKSKSAIQTACRGLGYDSDIGQYLASFVPVERGDMWSLKDCIYGNEEKDRKPIKQLIDEIEQYPRLKETALKIEGLINKRSIHAGGVVVLNEDYTKMNAMMKAPNGTPITQLNLDDTQACGAIKFDILTIEANDKIQECMNLLLKYGEIEWQGTLRKTFEKYFHPEIINKDNPELFKMIGEDKIVDLFQFSTQLGQAVVKKAKPKNLIELVSLNSLMRLMSDGEEQPIDTFIRYKNDITLWYDEMREHGLTDDEVKIFEKYLQALNGVADTQEAVMLMAMDENIAGFTVKEANYLRKGIAKKKKELQEEVKEKLFLWGRERGTRDEVIDYLWLQITRMLGYAFSIPHTLAYTLIAMVEANLSYYYNPLYWQTACLTVNSGSLEVDESTKQKSTNYGKVAEAIGKMKGHGVNVAQPLINQAEFGFVPDINNERIIFSFKGIVGIGDEVAHTILENRPYTSFEDFYERMYETKLVKKSHVLQLIKAGAFNEFDVPRQVMKRFVMKEIGYKETLNMQNMKSIISLGLLDTPELSIYKELFNFKEYISKKVVRTIETPNKRSKTGFSVDKVLGLDEIAKEFYEKTFDGSSILGYNYVTLEISEKQFTKEYNEKMKDFKDNIITSKEFIKKYNETLFINEWYKVASGSVSKWEMDSISYYESEHELANVNTEKYNIVNFFELDEEPVVVGYTYFKDKQIPKQKVFTIIGTVLDRNATRHTITVLTPDGVVTVKTHAGAFSHYDKQISRKVGDKKEVVEKSWFTRGNLVLLNGFRREEMFVLKTYKIKGEENQRTVNLIKQVENNGDLILQTERAGVY